jgi:hypothetical protein
MIFARLGDKKQTRRQNMAEIVFSWGVSEIKCIIFKENNDNPYEIHNNYIELSIVFHPMIFFLGNNIHLMSAPEGNSFVFPRISMFPETKSRETLRFEGKQN